MRFEDFDKSQFDARLQQVMDQRHGPESDTRLCEFAYSDENAATQLRAAEFIASPPAAVAYPTAGFADRILARIREEDIAERRLQNAPIWRRKTGLYWGLGLAAAASFALVLGVWNSSPERDQVAAHSPVTVDTNEKPSTDAGGATLTSEAAQKEIMQKLVVREDKVAQLRSGLKPFRSTLAVTIHVLRSTVPTRTPQPAPRPVEGKPSTAILAPKWVA